MDDDIEYFRRRAEQERAMARKADSAVRGVHEEFARLYAARAAAGLPEGEQGLSVPMANAS